MLGVAWGRTLAAMTRSLAQLPRVDVVQVAGNPSGLEYSQNPVDIVHRIAAVSGGRPYPFYVPIWAEEEAVAAHLRSTPDVALALAMCDRLDALVVGVGSWSPAESGLRAGLPEGWLREAEARGVRADVCRTLIDADGRAVAGPLDRLGIGLTEAQLRRIPNVIGVGGGPEKAEAVRAALRGGWIHTLVTDSGAAERLLS